MSKNNLIQIGGELVNTVGDGIIADAAAVKDYTEGKTQATINAEIRAAFPRTVAVTDLNTIDATGMYYTTDGNGKVSGIVLCTTEIEDGVTVYVQSYLHDGVVVLRSGSSLPLTGQWVNLVQMQINDLQNSKVSKRTGYDLSKNDFSDYYKGTVDALMRDVARLTDGKLGWEFVAELPAISYNTLNKVYFIQSTVDANCVDAWIADTTISPNAWKQIGKSIDTSVFYQKPSTGIPASDLAEAVQTSLENAGTAVQPAAMNAALNGKQNTIDDLATIRSGAATGATAYQKPSTGIPKTDLAPAVQTSLERADTALQTHQDISGKADVAALAGYTPTANFATINGASITGGGDIIITAGSSSITTIDAVPTKNSTNPVQSGGVYDAIEGGFYY